MNSARWQEKRYYYNSYLWNAQYWQYSRKPKILKENEQTVLIVKLIVQNHEFFFLPYSNKLQVLWIHWSFANMNFKEFAYFTSDLIGVWAHGNVA